MGGPKVGLLKSVVGTSIGAGEAAEEDEGGGCSAGPASAAKSPCSSCVHKQQNGHVVEFEFPPKFSITCW
jgi:hypothetical protein